VRGCLRGGLFRVPIYLAVLLFSPLAHSVEFSFSWQPGMTCAVESHMSKPAGGKASQVITLRYALKVGSTDQGELVVTTEDPQLVTDKGSVEEREFYARQLTATNMPPFRIRPDGELVGLNSLEDTRKTLRNIYEVSLPKPVNQQSLDRVMEIVGSKEFLEHIVRLFWDPTVGLWVGRQIDLNKPFEFSSTQQLPLGFPAQVRMAGTGKLVSLANCERAGASRTCAQLKSTTQVDPEDFKRVVAKLMSKYGATADPNQSRLDTFNIQISVEATTEPDTMVPHHVVLQKEVSLSGLEKGQDVRQSSSERYEWTFSCE
jgi:hypothetical protein